MIHTANMPSDYKAKVVQVVPEARQRPSFFVTGDLLSLFLRSERSLHSKMVC